MSTSINIRADGEITTFVDYFLGGEDKTVAADCFDIESLISEITADNFPSGAIAFIYNSLGGTFLTSIPSTPAAPVITRGGSGSSSFHLHMGDLSNLPKFEDDTGSLGLFHLDAITVGAIDFLAIMNLDCETTAVGSVSGITFDGSVGTASGSSVNVTDVTSTNPHGDCFSQVSGGAGHIN